MWDSGGGMGERGSEGEMDKDSQEKDSDRGMDKDSQEKDSDREMDSLGYRKEKFDRFIHDYRERAQLRASGSESDTPLDAALGRDFVNVGRKLKKALYTLRRLPNTESLDELCSQIESLLKLFKKIMTAKKDNGEEFNLHNIPLPDYDPIDIELLLGGEFVSARMAQESEMSRIEKTVREQMIGSIKEAEILLKECDEAKRLCKEKVLQNMQSLRIS